MEWDEYKRAVEQSGGCRAQSLHGSCVAGVEQLVGRVGMRLLVGLSGWDSVIETRWE